MNVLIINYEYPPLGGGAGRQCKILACELSKKHRINVLTSNYEGLKNSEALNKNLSITRINVGRKYIFRARTVELATFIIKGIIEAIRLVRKNNIDVVISFFAVPSGVISYATKVACRVPYIVSLRGFDVPGHLTKEYGIFQLLSTPLLRLVLNNSDKTVAVSKYLAVLAQKISPDKNIEVINNSIEKIVTKINNSKNNTVNILAVGRLTQQKQFDYLLKSLYLLDKNLKYTLYIAGDGPERENLEKLNRNLNLEGKVKLLGWLNKKKIEELYKKSDIFVMPSIEEGMSNVMLEALSFGLPIVALNIPGNSGLVQDGYNGYLIPLDNKKLLTVKISDLVSNSKNRKIFSKNSTSLAKKYNPQIMSDSYLKILKEVVINKETPSFDFGENWINYTKKYLSREKKEDAKKSLKEIFKDQIKDKTFLDIGCGSGLFSLAALKLGAKRIVSFDINSKSVECCQYLRKIEGNPSSWEIKKGSVLDRNFVDKLGKFDVVYSFGVLHHTGSMYSAIKTAAQFVKNGGLFYITIYNKTNSFGIYPLENFGSSGFWKKEKEIYVKMPNFIKNAVVTVVSYLTKEKKNNRGMSKNTDLKDWLGGYPYEYAGADEIFSYVKNLGFNLEYLKTNSGLKNNEFLFRKNGINRSLLYKV